MPTISGGNAAPDAIANDLTSISTRALFLSELRQSGLLGPDGTVGFVTVDSPGPVTAIDAAQTPVVIENVGATTLDSTGRILAALGPNASATLGPGHNDTVIGGSGSNYIVGNDARSLLIAGTGREMIQSGHGRDTILGGTGPDTLTAGGRSQVEAGSGRTSIEAGNSDRAQDTVYAGSGPDTISLGHGDNTVVMGGGRATIQAGSGRDVIIGGAGAATIASGAQTTVALGKGAVTLNAPAATPVNDTIYGGSNTGELRLNVASTAATVTQVDENHAVITFGANVIHTVNDVNVVFSDQTHKNV